jgi:hypothetical protein
MRPGHVDVRPDFCRRNLITSALTRMISRSHYKGWSIEIMSNNDSRGEGE